MNSVNSRQLRPSTFTSFITVVMIVLFIANVAQAYEMPRFDHDAVVLTEKFEANSLPPFLLQSNHGTPAIFRNGAIIFPGKARPQGRRDLGASRSYLRTAGSDFSAVSFIADVTVTLTPGTAYGTAFLGMGTAEPTEDFWGEPRQGKQIYCRAAPTAFANGYFGVTRERAENPVPAVQPGAGDGTHRLRLIWDAELHTATFAIHRGYTGGRFKASAVLGPIAAARVGFDGSNSSIFFGGAENVRFDDLIIAVADGIPLAELDDFAELSNSRVMHTQSTVGGYGQPPRTFREPMCNDSSWQRFKALFKIASCSNLDRAADACNPGLLSISDACRCPGGSAYSSDDQCVARSLVDIDRNGWRQKSLDNSRGLCNQMNCWKDDDTTRDHLDTNTNDLNFVSRLSRENPPRDGRFIYVYRQSDNDIYIRPFDRKENDRRFLYPGNCRSSSPFGHYACPMSSGQQGTYLHVRHSQLNGGWDPVWCAGEMRVEDGKVCLVNNESGHFQPKSFCLQYVKDTLSKWGVPTSDRAIFDDLTKASAATSCVELLRQRDGDGLR